MTAKALSGAGSRSGWMRLIQAAAVIILAPLIIIVGLYLAGGYVKTTGTWWYPFVPSLLSDYYVTGPFAMTSNTREDNPVWRDLPAFNKYQSRLTYAMSRGQPGVEVAWLLADAEWPDRPAIGEGKTLNAGESPLSRALAGAGIGYHRVSRSDLLGARVEDGKLRVGHAQFSALLIQDLAIAGPELLQQIQRISLQGLPVVWQGHLPRRAAGWRDQVNRDRRVLTLAEQLLQTVAWVDSPADVTAALRSSGLQQRLRPLPSTNPSQLRLNRRVIDGGEVILLFNEADDKVTSSFEITGSWRQAHLLDPGSGEASPLPLQGQIVSVEVPAGRVRLLLLQDVAGEQSPANAGTAPDSVWDWEQWQNPPVQLRPMMRWWWPGNAVETAELLRELRSLYDAGYGGVEIQTLTIGLSQQHLQDNEAAIYTVGTDSFFEHLKAVFRLAGELDMTVDLTLGSGWSSGGPFMRRYPEQQLLRAQLDVSGPKRLNTQLPQANEPWYAMPSNWIISNTIGEFDTDTRLAAVVAGRLTESGGEAVLSDLTDITPKATGDILDWDVPEGSHRIFALYQNATAHNSVASAYPGALHSSPVLDHLDPGGVAEYLEELGDPWLNALEPYTPRAVFIDSFELIGELPWATTFADRFAEILGYDITPYLPLVFRQRGESKYVNVVIPAEPAYLAADEMGQRIREDYEYVRQRLFLESFLQPMAQWADLRGVQLRLQAHGGYGDYLDSYKVADIPEAEGLFAGGSYDFLKLAASAGHIAGRRMVSSESFITMTTDFNDLALEDYYRLAGNAYAAGINVTVCHGYAYHY